MPAIRGNGLETLSFRSAAQMSAAAFHLEAYRKLRSKIRSQIRAFAIERQASLVGAICSW
jgi:hypothetical protein